MYSIFMSVCVECVCPVRFICFPADSEIQTIYAEETNYNWNNSNRTPAPAVVGPLINS